MIDAIAVEKMRHPPGARSEPVEIAFAQHVPVDTAASPSPGRCR